MRYFAIAVGALVLAGATPPPRQMKPHLVPCDSSGHVAPSNHIIVQGGIAPQPMRAGAVRPGDPRDMTTIGPKHDDPVDPHPNGTAMLGPKPDDPAALGPKQDDPGPPPSPDLHGSAASCAVKPGGTPR